MESTFYPYTKKQAIDISAIYNGVTKTEAKKLVEKDSAYAYGKQIDLGKIYAEMDNYNRNQAKKAFYED